MYINKTAFFIQDSRNGRENSKKIHTVIKPKHDEYIMQYFLKLIATLTYISK